MRLGRVLMIALWGGMALLPSESYAQPPFALPAPPPRTATAVLARVQALYGAAHSFSADFSIVSEMAAYDFKSTHGGHVVYTAPANADWTWDTGDSILFVGTTATSTSAGTRTALVTQVPNPYTSPYLTALAFLPGPVASSAYSFELDTARAGIGDYVLVGKPRPSTPTPAYPKVVYYVNPISFEIDRAFFADPASTSVVSVGLSFTRIVIR